MMQAAKDILWLTVCLGVGTIGLGAEPFAKGPYLGQTPPGPAARIFSPGLISDTRPQVWESNGTFSADGNTFCFLRVGGIFITEHTEQGWTAPKLIETIRESQPAAWGPCLSPDANSIYFTRAVGPVSKCNMYRSDRTAHGWTGPQSLGPPLSSPAYEVTCCIAMNNSMYFGSKRKYNKIRIWFAPFADNTWTRAVQIFLDHPHAGDPGIAPDESFMVFTSINLPGGYGHRDIYLTLRLPDGTWSKPRNLGYRINSSYVEHSPRISPDKKYLFFTRSNGWDPRKCSADIYWVALKEYLTESHR